MTEVSSLVERLRESAKEIDDTVGWYEIDREDATVLRDRLTEAASAIETLERDAGRLRYERDMASEALSSLKREVLEAIEPFANCAAELEGSEDVPRTPDEEWAKFRLVAYEYRRIAALRDKIRPEQP